MTKFWEMGEKQEWGMQFAKPFLQGWPAPFSHLLVAGEWTYGFSCSTHLNHLTLDLAQNLDLWRHYHRPLTACSLLPDAVEGYDSSPLDIWLGHVICFDHEMSLKVIFIILSLKQLINCLCVSLQGDLPAIVIR